MLDLSQELNLTIWVSTCVMWRVLHRCLESHNIHPTLSSHSHIMFLSERKASNSELNGIFMSWDRERKSKLDRSLRSHLISSMISWWQWYQLHPSALLPATLIGEICCFDCHLTSHLTSTPPLSPHTHSEALAIFTSTSAHAIKRSTTSSFLCMNHGCQTFIQNS